MNVKKKNFKDAANENNYSVEIFIDKSTGELCYRNSLGQKILINTENQSINPKDKLYLESAAVPRGGDAGGDGYVKVATEDEKSNPSVAGA